MNATNGNGTYSANGMTLRLGAWYWWEVADRNANARLGLLEECSISRGRVWCVVQMRRGDGSLHRLRVPADHVVCEEGQYEE